MNRKTYATFWLALIFTALSSLPTLVTAEEKSPPSSTSSFRSGKIVWDLPLIPMRSKDALMQIRRIRNVHERLVKDGVKPQMVIIAHCRCSQEAKELKIVEAMQHPAMRKELQKEFRDLAQRPGIKIYTNQLTQKILLEWNVGEGLILTEDPVIPLVNYQLEGYALIPAYSPRLQ